MLVVLGNTVFPRYLLVFYTEKDSVRDNRYTFSLEMLRFQLNILKIPGGEVLQTD